MNVVGAAAVPFPMNVSPARLAHIMARARGLRQPGTRVPGRASTMCTSGNGDQALLRSRPALPATGAAVGLDRAKVFSILTPLAPGVTARERGFLQEQRLRPCSRCVTSSKTSTLGLRIYSGGVATPLTQQTRDVFAETLRESADLDISAVVRGRDEATTRPRGPPTPPRAASMPQ